MLSLTHHVFPVLWWQSLACYLQWRQFRLDHFVNGFYHRALVLFDNRVGRTPTAMVRCHNRVRDDKGRAAGIYTPPSS
ncbi:hypothetical protein DFH29DRAFT_932415 [Suillus ampliporus]|nr:hypothetical protein DFH29DRAFT_932415 [Suillus ampliporus]